MENIDKLNEKLALIGRQTRIAIDNHRYPEARNLILQVLELVENHPVALCDLAFVENSLGNFDAAYRHAQQALRYSTQATAPNIYDELASITHRMNRFEESHHYGRLAIQGKKDETAHLPAYPLPAATAPGLSSDRTKNIISYSLFGGLPRYCETAVLNVALAAEIYPEWTCRFYVDDSVPAAVKGRLKKAGAQVVEINAVQQKNVGLYWRFYVLGDADVQCFIIRDADSLLSYKERAAVDQWLASGKWFHTMRDADNHTELILAGMWGGHGGVFPDMETMVREHYGSLQVINRTIDQHFLRRAVWPTVAQSVLTHCSRHLSDDSLPFPAYPISDIEKTPGFHVGMIDAHALQTKVEVDNPAAKRVRWHLHDEHNQTVCSYETDDIRSGKLVLQLPYRYSTQIRDGAWQIYLEVLA